MGDSYTYKGDDGSRLEVSFVGVENRSSRNGQDVPSVIVRYIYSPSRSDWPSFEFEEALDASGLILQQVSLCGVWVADGADLQGLRCYDERALVAFTGQGLPGALGAGLRLSHLKDGARVANGDCETGVAFQANGSAWARALPPVVNPGAATFCANSGLPSQFTLDVPWPKAFSLSPTAYRLESESRGSVPLDWPTAPSNPWRSGPLPRLPQTPPYYLSTSDPFPFSTWDAHEAALGLDSAYSDLWNQTGSVLTGSKYSLMGETRLAADLTNETREHRLLEVTGTQGFGIRTEIRRTTTNSPLGPQTGFSLRGSHRFVAPAPRIIPEAASIGDALDFSAQLIGVSHRGMSSGFSHTATSHPWMTEDAPVRTDGFEISLFFPDPSPAPAIAQFLYSAAFDGPTGGLTLVNVDRAKLPLEIGSMGVSQG